MLRKGLLVFLSTLIFAFSLFGTSFAVESTRSGDWVPWPFGREMEFPWEDIQGIWKAQGNGFSAYFALRATVEKGAGVKILKIKQLDTNSCKTLATGVGVESDYVVLAQMTAKDGRTYRLSIRAFDPSESPEPAMPGMMGRAGNVMVLSISNVGMFTPGMGPEVAYVQISKQTNGLTVKDCLTAVEKNKR